MMSPGRQPHGADQPRVAHRRDLRVAERLHEAQFAEHLHVLFIMRDGLADRLFAGGSDVELVAERQPLAELPRLRTTILNQRR